MSRERSGPNPDHESRWKVTIKERHDQGDGRAQAAIIHWKQGCDFLKGLGDRASCIILSDLGDDASLALLQSGYDFF